jgi:hypothetical protein
LKGRILVFLGLSLLANTAFALTGPVGPYQGRDDAEATTIWTTKNVYGVSDLTQYGEPTSTDMGYRFVSSITNNVTVDVNAQVGTWSVRDSVDSLSFRTTATGYVLTRRKVGYTGVNTITFDKNGNKISETSTLSAPVSATFGDAMDRLAQHYNANPQAAASKSQVGSGGMSCKAGLVVAGLAVVGESMGYGALWAAGGLAGIAATPAYILAVRATNSWAMDNCGLSK